MSGPVVLLGNQRVVPIRWNTTGELGLDSTNEWKSMHSPNKDRNTSVCVCLIEIPLCLDVKQSAGVP